MSGTTIAARPLGFEQRQDVLDEVELLVGGLDDEVVADRRLVCPLRSERRVGEDDVEALARGRLVDRVAERDVRFNLVKVEVH